MSSLQRLQKLLRILATGDYRRAFCRHRVAAGVEHEPLLRSLPYRTVIDVGANRGQFALAAHRAQPEARIISFEPLPNAVKIYRRVLPVAVAEVLPVAIGASTQKGRLHVSRQDNSSSLLPVGRLQAEIFPGTEECSSTEVDLVRLQDVVAPEDLVTPVLLKIDVQGYELEVLRGCAEMLAGIELMYVECSFLKLYEGQALASDVIEFLHGHGYRLEGVFNLAHDRRSRPVQADFLFRRTGTSLRYEATEEEVAAVLQR